MCFCPSVTKAVWHEGHYLDKLLMAWRLWKWSLTGHQLQFLSNQHPQFAAWTKVLSKSLCSSTALPRKFLLKSITALVVVICCAWMETLKQSGLRWCRVVGRSLGYQLLTGKLLAKHSHFKKQSLDTENLFYFFFPFRLQINDTLWIWFAIKLKTSVFRILI